MLIDKETNSVIITTFNAGDGNCFTGDGIELNENYSLVYEIEGKKPIVFNVSGTKLVKDFSYIANTTDHNGEISLLKLQKFLSIYVVLWGTFKTYRKVHKKILNDYSSDDINFVKRSLKGKQGEKLFLNKILSAYLYLRLMERDEDEMLNTLYLLDCKLDDASIKNLKTTWMDSPIAQRGEISSYEELYQILSNGVLKASWVSDPKDVINIQ